MENDLIEQERRKLFIDKKYTELIQKVNENLKTTNISQQQVDGQYWLGRCYFERALQTDNETLFDKAREHFEKRLEFAKKLSGDKALKKTSHYPILAGLLLF